MRTYRILYLGEVIAESDCPSCDVSMGVLEGPCTVTPAYDKVRAYFRAAPKGTVGDRSYMEALKRYYDAIEALQIEVVRSDGFRVQPLGIEITDFSAELPEQPAYYLQLPGCDRETIHGWLDDHPDAKR